MGSRAPREGPAALVVDLPGDPGADAANAPMPADVLELIESVRGEGGAVLAIGPDGAGGEGELDAERIRGFVRGAAVEVAETLLVTGSASGVTAGREAGCAAVVGRAGRRGASRLRAAGADAVVGDLRGFDFRGVRRRERRPVAEIPFALDAPAALDCRLARGAPAVFLDYDGTLTPIVDDPEAAHLGADMCAVISDLAARMPVAIVSGRDRRDVEQRVGLEGLYYAGGHGFDISGPGLSLEYPGGVSAGVALDAAEASIRERVRAIPGALVERKRFSIALHYRNVAPEHLGAIFEAVREAARHGLEPSEGKKVVELGPAVDWHKGSALIWLLESLDLDAPDVVPMFVGDDRTDENAFAVLGGDGIGVLVGDAVAPTSWADLRVADQSEVSALLRRVGEGATNR